MILQQKVNFDIRDPGKKSNRDRTLKITPK